MQPLLMKGNCLTLKRKARTGLEQKIFMFLYSFVAYCTVSMTIPFCCQISETVRETQIWRRNRKLKQDLGS
jgi:hypothetical protein